MRIGQTVKLKKDTIPWYSGYGVNRSVVLPKGLEGTVTHVGVIPVYGRKLYNVARFDFEGESWQTNDV